MNITDILFWGFYWIFFSHMLASAYVTFKNREELLIGIDTIPGKIFGFIYATLFFQFAVIRELLEKYKK